jgi:hypothetical protein
MSITQNRQETFQPKATLNAPAFIDELAREMANSASERAEVHRLFGKRVEQSVAASATVVQSLLRFAHHFSARFEAGLPSPVSGGARPLAPPPHRHPVPGRRPMTPGRGPGQAPKSAAGQALPPVLCPLATGSVQDTFGPELPGLNGTSPEPAPAPGLWA